MTNEESDKEIDELLKESSQNEQSNILDQAEIDELVKEIVGLEITERDFDNDIETPIPSIFEITDTDNKTLKKFVNEKFKLIKFDAGLVLCFFGEIISRGGLYIDLHALSKKKKYFIRYLISRYEWGKEAYISIKKNEQQNKRQLESISCFITELQKEQEKLAQKEDAKISFCGETVNSADVINAIKSFDKYVNDTLIPRVWELQKRIDKNVDGVKKLYANHLPIFHIFMRKEIKVWQELNDFLIKEGNFIWNTKNELVGILEK